MFSINWLSGTLVAVWGSDFIGNSLGERAWPACPPAANGLKQGRDLCPGPLRRVPLDEKRGPPGSPSPKRGV